MTTRTDGALQAYFRVFQDKDQVDEQDIQQLLDAYRTAYKVDLVFIGEAQAGGMTFPHVSGEGADTLVWEGGRYDRERLCESGGDISVLHYGIFQNGDYDGAVGMAVLRPGRVWTEEERLAVRQMGRALRHILYIERGSSINAAERQKLDQQDHVLETIFNISDCGIVRHSLDGRQLYSVNQAALDILGYESQAALLAEGFDMMVSAVLEEDKPKLRQTIQALKKPGDSGSFAYRVRHRDGSILNVVGKATILEENGHLLCQRFLIDCTAQRAQEEREIAEEKLRQTEMIRVLTMDFGAVYLVDLRTMDILSTQLDSHFLHLYGPVFPEGADLEEGLEQFVRRSVYETDREALLAAASPARLARENKELSFAAFRAVSHGRLEYFQMKAVRAGEGRVVIGFRSVDEETRHELAQIKLVKTSYEIISGLISDYNFIALINPDNGGMSAYKADDTLPEVQAALSGHEYYYDAIAAYAAFVHPDDRDFWFQATKLETVLEKLEERKIYNVNIRNATHERMEYVQFSFTKIGGGRDTQLVLAKRVITEIMEREIQQRMLIENALTQAKRANMAKSTFLSNMSHDIRTPMNAIIGFTALAIAHIDQKERVREYLEKIMSSGNHLLSLINDVLDMSRIESGKVYLEEKPCNLTEILCELRDILQADISQRHLRFSVDISQVRNESIFCDKLRLNQILLNLLSNAVKFTPPGGSIAMKVVEKSAAAGLASFDFSVSDTGIGMSEDFLERIFDPFERERNSTISGIQGTGLGMAITRNLVELMNGHIAVQSRQGEGTEFVVSLTFRLQNLPSSSRVIPALEGRYALVVDVDQDACAAAAAMLEQIGLKSACAHSAGEAMELLRRNAREGTDCRVCLLDRHIVDTEGMPVIRRLLLSAGEEAPLLILTAADWSDIALDAKRMGVTGFCGRPLFFSELYGCLQRLLRGPEEGVAEEQRAVRDRGRILLVEDNELNREIATELLTEAGFQLETAENGQVAVEMVRSAPPDHYRLVLMDIQMPVMDGYTATRTIRAIPGKEALPILAMTANAFKEDKQKALESGMNGHIAKPIDVRNLMETLDSILLELEQ